MSDYPELSGETDSPIDQVLGERRKRSAIDSDFTERVASAATGGAALRGLRLGVPAWAVAVLSILTASTAVAGIVTVVRNASTDGPLRGLSALFSTRQQPPGRSIVADLRIFSSDSIPQALLSVLGDVVVAPDGYIFAFDSKECASGCIRVYNAGGRFVRAFGRMGDGPGELSTNVDLVLAAGDSVVVHDRTKGTINTFRRSGVHVRDVEGLELGRGGNRALRGYLGGGSLLVEVGYWRWPTWDSSALRIADAGLRDVARIAGWKAYNALTVPEMRFSSIRQPFFPLPQAAQDPTAPRALAALPSLTFGGQPGQVKLVVVNASGIQSERIVNIGARRMTAAIRDAWIKSEFVTREAAIKTAGKPRAALEEELRKQLVTFAYVPEIDRAMFGSDGAAWLKLHGVDEWLIVSSNGSLVARVHVPPEVRVFQVSVDRMWGAVWDSDGVPSIVRYRVS